MATTQLAILLEERVKKASEELDAARKEAQAANKRVEALSDDFESFSKALAREKNGNHLEPATMEEPQGATSEEATYRGEINRSHFARELISKNAERGITGKELGDAFREAGLKVHVNYPNSLLSRLRQGEEIRQIKGRYYPVKLAVGGE